MHLTPKSIFVYIAIIIVGVIFSSVSTILFFQKTPSTHVQPVSINTLATSTQGGAFSFPEEENAPPSSGSITLHKELPQDKKVAAQKIIPISKKTVIIQKKNSTTVNNNSKQTTPISITTKPSNLSTAAVSIRKALVNITCEIKMTRSIAHTSGSGVFISPKGYIITNAHVAQYLLLKNYPHKGATTCVVRMGSPAVSRYDTKLVFLSSDWMYSRATTTLKLINKNMENGKHDIAVLAITGVANATGVSNYNNIKVPTVFPFVSLGYDAPVVNEPVIIGSYAAQFLSQELLQSSLYPTIAYGSIKKIYTFASTTADIATLGGTVAAQEGSSGGGVLNSNDKLTALIVIGTVTGPTNTRNLSAITAQYIRRAYKNETGKSINSLFAESTTTAIQAFSSEREKLSSYFKKNLVK